MPFCDSFVISINRRLLRLFTTIFNKVMCVAFLLSFAPKSPRYLELIHPAKQFLDIILRVHSSLFPTISISAFFVFFPFAFNFPFISLLSLFKAQHIVKKKTQRNNDDDHDDDEKLTIMNCLYFCDVFALSYVVVLWAATRLMMRISTGVFVPKRNLNIVSHALLCFFTFFPIHNFSFSY